MTQIKLTNTVNCGGCAAKINPIDLYAVLSKLPNPKFKELIVGYDTGDDACVYMQNENSALIFTTDFIAPLVDNPFDFGRVAATNALSDIYAMGGTPLLALNIVCFDEKLGYSVLEEILLGSAEVCNNSNTILCGGHTVKSSEIRYGLAVIGQVHPDKIITNSNGKAGDILVLTKPLGTGILCQALKYGLLSDELIQVLTNQLCELNDKAAQVMQTVGVKCATDITGFGLAGHLHKLTKASNCGAEINLDALPFLPTALELASDNIHSGILKRNQEFVSEYLTGNFINHSKSKLLFDPQTSGGLLITIEKNKFSQYVNEMKKINLPFFEIGKLTHSLSNKLIFL